MTTFYWNAEKLAPELKNLLTVLCDEYPGMFLPGFGDRELVFKKTRPGVLKVTNGQSKTVIEAGSLDGFARGIGCAMAESSVKETTPFRTMGIMIDCSRNKVFTVDFMKSYLVKIALMGYNMAMLYTEDTYQLPGEPMFGYMRGRYTMNEIKELDAFAKQLGIELIACIQTLGHLGQILRWNAYSKVKDTGNVLFVDQPETYQLIEKMVLFWKEALSSKRIHIGMDETHDLGRGRFHDLNGDENAFQIFNRHLKKVNEICQKNELSPIIWSDMYFRLGNKNLDYYDRNTKIPAKVKAEIPKNVQLCYWDYYHEEADFYEDFIQLHRNLGSEPILGSGVWTWSRAWYDHTQTAAAVVPCIEASRKTNLKEIFFTMWGDNGGYCIYESALAGLEFAAGLAYGNLPSDSALYAKRMLAICNADYNLYLSVSELYKHMWTNGNREILPEKLIWDDPLMGMAYTEYTTRTPKVLVEYEKIMKKIILELSKANLLEAPELQTILAFVQTTALKIAFRRDFLKAYEKRDNVLLRKVANEMIPAVIAALEEYDARFRENWLCAAKPFGLEVIQRRNAGQIARLKEARLRILELLDGIIETIEEMDAALEAAGVVSESGHAYSGTISL